MNCERFVPCVLVVVAAAGLGGCSPADDEYVVPRDTGGDRWTGADAGADADPDGTPDGWIPPDDCSEAAKLVYVLDSDRTLYRFNPRIADPSAFERVGTVDCASGGDPNSMAVGRDGYAYALYGADDFWTGTYQCYAVNRVDIDTAECLGPTPYACGTSGFQKFGMGFATDGPDTTDETLYVGNSIDGRLASLDVGSGVLQVLGELPESGPEFTGNALGELWGFFPYLEPPQAVQLDKASGAALRSLDLSALPSAALADEAAWAWAFWGGSFYIFYQVTPPDSSTNVYKLDLDGTLTVYIRDTGLRIVGAGVSTCAPVVII
jgi:hypothetical protein